MVWTKATIIKWDSLESQVGHDSLNEDRMDFISNAVATDKTNGLYDVIDDVTTKRYWLDQAAAEEFKQFILTETANLGITSPNIEIIDNVE
jgi:hypothetical protein